MVSCPKCGTSVDSEFGLAQCLSCHYTFYIDENGIVEQPDSEDAAVGSDDRHLKETIQEDDVSSFGYGHSDTVNNDDENILSSDSEDVDINSPLGESFTYEEPEYEQPLASEVDNNKFDHTPMADDEVPLEMPEWTPEGESSINDGDTSNSQNSWQANQGIEIDEEYIPEEGGLFGQSEQNSTPFAEVENFANSLDMDNLSGNLLYTLKISGIDTKEQRAIVKDCLQDARFLWNPEEIIASIENGVLTISSISPVKASVLLNRLKELDVTISWTQEGIHN